MSISRACYVSCDNCGDPAPVVTEASAVVARGAARAEGYVRQRVDGVMCDLCPACAGATTLDGDRVRPWNYNLRLDPSTL